MQTLSCLRLVDDVILRSLIWSPPRFGVRPYSFQCIYYLCRYYVFLFIKQTALYNYADDNMLTCFSRTLPNLVRVLEEEAGVAQAWLKESHMIANPSKFHALLIKKRLDEFQWRENKHPSIRGKTIESEDSVKLLGIQLDYKLNFDPHITELRRKGATQLNAPKRLRSYSGFEERKVLVRSFAYSNFNYCPLVWHFC